MSVSDKSMRVANNFSKFLQDGNKSSIEQYTIEELKQVKYEYSKSSNAPFYKVIEDRIAELLEAMKNKKSKKEKWFDRVIGFALGVISTLLCRWLIGS